MGFVFTEEDLLEYANIRDVYKYCNHYDLFRFYIGDFKLGKTILSPLSQERVPSFAVYAYGNRYRYKDFRLGGGDIIQFVREKYNMDLRQAINKIIYDSGLSDKFKTELSYPVRALVKHNKKISYTKPQIDIKSRNSTSYDLEFWNDFLITKETLNKYGVRPIEIIFINNAVIKAEKYAYAFREFKDNEASFTIYQPFSEKKKWMKSHNHSVIYGWSQLPESGDTLIITKSLKDIMTIDSVSGIPVISLQGESVMPKDNIMKELKSRFKTIYLFYDNDFESKENWGRILGAKIADKFDIFRIEIPDDITNKFKAKDISDLAKNGDEYQVKKILDNLNTYII